MVRVKMMQTDMIQGLKTLVNETRGSSVGAQYKKYAASAFVELARKVLYVNGMDKLAGTLTSKEVFVLCHLQIKAKIFSLVHFYSVYTACNPNYLPANFCFH